MKRYIFILLSLVSINIASSIDDIAFGIPNFSAGGASHTYGQKWQAALTNPAILGHQGLSDGVVLENSSWILNTTLQQIAAGFEFEGYNLNFGLLRLSDTEKIEYTNVSGDVSGYGYYDETILYLATGTKLSNINFGTTLKLFNKKAVGTKSFYTMDLGILYDNESFWRCGLKLNNILGNSAKNDKLYYYLFSIGLYFSDILCDFIYNENTGKVSSGISYLQPGYSISGGLDEDQSPSLGIQVNIWGLIINYGYKNIVRLGTINRIGVAYEF